MKTPVLWASRVSFRWTGLTERLEAWREIRGETTSRCQSCPSFPAHRSKGDLSSVQRAEGFAFSQQSRFPSCPNSLRGQSYSLHCFQKFLICVFLPILLLWTGMRKEHFHSSRKSPSGQSLPADSLDLTYLLTNKQRRFY